MRRAFSTSRVAKVLFQDLACTSSFQAFIGKINAELDTVEHNDFAEDDVESFRQIVRAEVRDLVESGIKAYERKETAIYFFTAKVQLVLSDLGDEWYLRLMARLKAAAVSARALAKLPWEDALYGDGAVPGFRELIKLPASVLVKVSNAREVAIRALGGARTLAEIRKILSTNHKALSQLDRSAV